MSKWIHEDELPDDYDYDANFSRSKVMDGVRMFPSDRGNPAKKSQANAWKGGVLVHFPVCCDSMANALSGGTDNEGYGAVAVVWPDGIHIGSIMDAINYCPWCGAKPNE